MDLTKLSYFVAAAECGSFTAAARRQYTTQPNISKQMSALEEELGTKLFVRENRSVRLTEAGKYLYDQAREVPARAARVLETTRAIGRSGTGELTIYGTGTVGGTETYGVENHAVGHPRPVSVMDPEAEDGWEFAGWIDVIVP